MPIVAVPGRFNPKMAPGYLAATVSSMGPERATPRFEGMFAFAYFDARNNSLWLACDRMAIKLLFIARVGRERVFGSEPKTLFAHPQVG